MVEKTTSNKLRILSLFRSSYMAQFHVREIAKLTQKSHVTLLPHLQALEEDHVLTPKIVGKNKLYSLNLQNIAAKQYLLLAEVVESTAYFEEIFVIKKLTSEIFKLNLGGTVILFGSYAKRTFKEDSDIDLFYIGKISDSNVQKIKDIGRTYGKTINIKNSTVEHFASGLRKKDALIAEILKNHVLLQNGELFINALWGYYYEIK